MSSQRVGALDLSRRRPGALSAQAPTGGLLAAELAALPLLDMLAAHREVVSGTDEDGWEQLASLDRVEVDRATGMIIGALAVGPTEALVRLRAHACACDMAAVEVASQIADGRLPLGSRQWQDSPHLRGPDQSVG